MTQIISLLKRANNRKEVPLDAYIFYNLEGGIYWLGAKDYPNFILEWLGVSKPPPITLDLSSPSSHSIILDFDYYPESGGNTSFLIIPVIESILKTTFIPAIPNFTYIIAVRRNHKGIHVHLPEIKMSHDDYIILCEFLQAKFRQATLLNNTYKLDILMNAMLPGAAKPNLTPYYPHSLVYVDERDTVTLDCLNIFEDLENAKKKFKKLKNNEKSIFRNLLNCNPTLMIGELRQLMMPVVRADIPIHSLMYPTSITKNINNSVHWQTVTNFVYKKTKEQGYFNKSLNFAFDNYSLTRLYYHLKLNAVNMVQFETNNHAIKMWYERFSQVSAIDNSHIPRVFVDLHDMLQFEHATLSEDPNPLKTIMQFNEGYYFLPVFFALCQHFQKDSVWMADQLYDLLDKEFHPLLTKIRVLNPKNIQYEISDISINTLHFCANNLYDRQPKTNKDKLKSIVENNRRLILSVTNADQMTDLIRSMQERHLPIRVLKLKNAIKKPMRYVWNPLTESWQEVNGNSEIHDHLSNLWTHVKQFYNDYHLSGGMGGPNEDLLQKFSVGTVVSSIHSDTAIERINIQMDNHKWFLRLQDGVLDLLTGHIGGVVPEFFLSDRKINIGIPRKEMQLLCNDHLKNLYLKLTEKKFFLNYLHDLFLDKTDNLFDTLMASLPEAKDELSKSMLHFYVNLCKCASFDYELLMYLLDVLASVYVGTNYERKFFVWKGRTRNGKSKLFELMGRVLGGYYHSIQSENLSPSHSSGSATPELASTLFSCRMVAIEELDKKLHENRVKQITGNSYVTFRNLYEQNSGGIPTAKLFATTNNYPECKASEAFKDRVVAIPFEAEFADNAPPTTSLQVERNTFRKEVYVVQQSFKGCFLTLYYHLKHHIGLDDGLLHYREEPENVVEFTHEYLIHADIYVQFKLFMDVQLKPGCSTTMNDVKSAVRQYLKVTKNTSFHEADLFMCFDKEYGELRRTDLNVDCNSYSFSVSEDEPRRKMAKIENDSFLVFYEGVVIKNLKRANFDD